MLCRSFDYRVLPHSLPLPVHVHVTTNAPHFAHCLCMRVVHTSSGTSPRALHNPDLQCCHLWGRTGSLATYTDQIPGAASIRASVSLIEPQRPRLKRPDTHATMAVSARAQCICKYFLVPPSTINPARHGRYAAAFVPCVCTRKLTATDRPRASVALQIAGYHHSLTGVGSQGIVHLWASGGYLAKANSSCCPCAPVLPLSQRKNPY